jgi:hypothetical protein
MTAAVVMTTYAGTVTLADQMVNITGDYQAECNVVAYPGIMTLTPYSGVQGDYIISPIWATGLTGSVTAQTQVATREAWEDPLGTAGTIWIAYLVPVSGEFQLSTDITSTTQSVNVFQGTGPEDLVDTGVRAYSLEPSTDFFVTAGDAYFIRAQSATTDSPITVSWRLTAASGLYTITVANTQIQETPGVVMVLLSSAAPNETIALSIEGTSGGSYANVSGLGLGVTTTILTDELGSATCTIPVPGVSAGTYQVKAVGSTSGTAVALFKVLNDAQLPPSAGASDSSYSPVSQTGVIKWVFQDPATGGLGNYIFPINPTTSTDPHPPKAITWDHTASIAGPNLGWDTAARAAEWKFSGTVLTQAFHDKLVAYAALNHRFWIFDHLNRKWLCTIEQLTLTPKNQPNNYWVHTYDIVALVFKQG